MDPQEQAEKKRLELAVNAFRDQRTDAQDRLAMAMVDVQMLNEALQKAIAERDEARAALSKAEK